MRRGWTRRRLPSKPTPEAVCADLRSRVLADVDTCREVWEHTLDPGAVCEALRLSGLPEWLLSAALLYVSAPTDKGVQGITTHAWRDRDRDMIDRHRASTTAEIRSSTEIRNSDTGTPTWGIARGVADLVLKKNFGDQVPIATDAGLKRCYERVARGMANPWRYYLFRDGMAGRIDKARRDALALMQAIVERESKSKRK